MSASTNKSTVLDVEADMAKRRLLSVKGDPFVHADWERVVFLHFAFRAELLRQQISGPFELEMHEGRGIVTLVALSMRRFREAGFGPACVLRALREQSFLNLRTYVRCQDEPGALFLWGWLSRPFNLPLPRVFGLPYAPARMNYHHHPGSGTLSGKVASRRGGDALLYCAEVDPEAGMEVSAPGSLGAFALERYTGFFNRGNVSYVFRAWHPPWGQISVDVTLKDLSLVTNRFPWFAEGTLAGAHFAPGFPQVWLGRAHRVNRMRAARSIRHGRLSAFYEMP